MDIKKRLFYVVVAIFSVVAAGSCGFYVLLHGEPRFVDCIYMTIITVTTVGYGEVIEVSGNTPAEIFTMVLIVFGMGIILYGISTLTALLIEGELSGILRIRQMQKKIGKRRDHYIVCGGGETGYPLIVELAKNKCQVVLIEVDETRLERCKSIEGMLYVEGDATEDQNLINAGIDRAAGILVCLPSDKDNLYITMTARMMNKSIRIISRMINEKIRPKLVTAGANSVVSPNSIGALRMASEMIRPAAVSFLDRMLRSQAGDYRIHQIKISEGASVVGKTVAESGIKRDYNLTILGIQPENVSEIDFDPPAFSYTLKAGMALIVLGKVDKIVQAQADF